MSSIVTFYSFKGGVGRTMALANIAVQLAQRGRKVLAVDWDLEAPGLHRYFAGRVEAPRAGGLLSLLHAAQSSAAPPPWRDYTATVDLPFGGTLDLLPAVDRFGPRSDDDRYPQRLEQLDWSAFFGRHDGGAFIEHLRGEWRERYDVTLIDSRTGYTDSGGVCTILLPDVVVAVFTANEQSLDGVEEAIRKAQAARQQLDVDRPPLLVVPLPSRFDGRVEVRESERWMASFTTRLAPYYDDWLPRGTSYRRVIERTRVPHVPFYSFGEKLPALEQSETDPEGMAYAYAAITRLIDAGFEAADEILLGERADPAMKLASESVVELAAEVELDLERAIRRRRRDRLVFGAAAAAGALALAALVVAGAGLGLQIAVLIAMVAGGLLVARSGWPLVLGELTEVHDRLRFARIQGLEQPARLLEELQEAREHLRLAPGEPGARSSLRLASAALVGATLVIAGLLTLMPGAPTSGDTVDPAWLQDEPSGVVRYCAGTDVTGTRERSVSDYNRRRIGNSRVTLVETSSTADIQRNHYLDRDTNDCDIIQLDVAYLAEFAAKNLLFDMTPYLDADDRAARFDRQALATTRYAGKRWGVPKELDAGVLYYRADRARAPSSWQELYARARPRRASELPGLRVQANRGEGVTVFLLELAYSAGADSIVSPDGRTARIDQPQVLEVLRFLHDAIRDRVVPAIGSSGEAETLDEYERGRATFLRGWPYVRQRLRRDVVIGQTGLARRARRRTAERTRIVPLPRWQARGPRFGVLGGSDLVIPRSAHNPTAALHVVDYLTSDEQVRKDQREASLLPVLRSVAADRDLPDRAVLNAVEATQTDRAPSDSAVRAGVQHHLERRPADSRLPPGQRRVAARCAPAGAGGRAERPGRRLTGLRLGLFQISTLSYAVAAAPSRER